MPACPPTPHSVHPTLRRPTFRSVAAHLSPRYRGRRGRISFLAFFFCSRSTTVPTRRGDCCSAPRGTRTRCSPHRPDDERRRKPGRSAALLDGAEETALAAARRGRRTLCTCSVALLQVRSVGVRLLERALGEGDAAPAHQGAGLSVHCVLPRRLQHPVLASKIDPHCRAGSSLPTRSVARARTNDRGDDWVVPTKTILL